MSKAHPDQPLSDLDSDLDSNSDLIFDDDQDEQVLELGINARDGVVVTFKAFANHDANPADLRLKSSELTWQAWEAVCGASQPRVVYFGSA